MNSQSSMIVFALNAIAIVLLTYNSLPSDAIYCKNCRYFFRKTKKSNNWGSVDYQYANQHPTYYYPQYYGYWRPYHNHYHIIYNTPAPTTHKTPTPCPTRCEDYLSREPLENEVKLDFCGFNLDVYCEYAMNCVGSHWIVIMANQRAASGTNFMRNFVTYKQGISTGNITESILGDIYWIGLENLYRITNCWEGGAKLRIDIQGMKNGMMEEAYVEYDHFRIGNEKTKFSLEVSGFKGSVGVVDSLSDLCGACFSTMDADNDEEELERSCSTTFRGNVGGWFRNCGKTNLFGAIPPTVNDTTSSFFFGFNQLLGLNSVSMKIRPCD